MTTELTTKNGLVIAATFDEVFFGSQHALRGVSGWDDVAKLGSKNISALILNARSNEKSLTNNIASLKQQQELLRGKSGNDIEVMAKEFENPVLIEIGVPGDSWSKDPEPLDAASKNRARNATTFNVCGWCKHSGGGSCRYNYAISTTCSLLGDSSPATRFDTPCLLQSKTADEIAVQVERLEKEVADLLIRREKVRDGIKLLQHLKKSAPEKPYLISLRPHDHFNVGDEVMVYVGQWGESDDGCSSMVKDGVWVPAIVVFGYRHHDNCVSYQASFPIHTNMSYFEGRGGGCGTSRPEILQRSEFDYLQKCVQDTVNGDLDFIRIWLGNVDNDLKGFKKDKFFRDFFTGTLASPPADWQPPTDEIPVNTVKDAEHVLQMLNSSLFKNEKEIRDWAAMQLRHVHPDKLNGVNDNVKSYAARQTRAVIAACDLLIARLGSHQK